MPCQSYESEYPMSTSDDNSRALRDKLARIACKALEHIEQSGDGGLEVLILQDPEIAEWWSAHKAADAAQKKKEQAAVEKKKMIEERKAKKREILARLSEEEIKILGVK